MLLSLLQDYSVYLVSQSPRRRELLKAMGINFSTLSFQGKEEYPAHFDAVKISEYLSELKISNINFQDFPANSIFISCDTVVELDNKILGKPTDKAEAMQILKLLSGKSHNVISGLTVATKSQRLTKHAITKVQFADFADEEINYYVHTYLPLDKAGSYGAQEWIGMVGIRSIEGSFYNVMGLPTQLLWEILKSLVEKNRR